ncbi:toxin-antitoxin system, toxin component [Streptomyces sp. SID13031]|uniref:LppU/SCO3897 family protein n=1 Tax=Streptomyces sp. SID13031 TaxID=2706046 RepID=UPI0013C6DF9F|nr:toxin-antitoxin system, toxin component [Streptomyces sp. SID13031]NEA32545.1 toxin-antitoxin system, toxin component [Streptomyces sp. SID13031]
MTTPPQQPPFQPGGGGYVPPPGQPPYGQPPYGQPQPPYQQPGQPQGQPPFPQYGPGGPQGGQYQQPQPGQPPYGQPPYGQPQPPYQPQPQPGQYPQGQLQCRFCGGVPAVEATVRGHQGFIVLMRFLKLQGPFCKTCGTAATRDLTAKSMWQGWWGIASLIINPITMFLNLGTYSKFKNLPEPAPGAPGRPMDPGKPLFKRPVALGLLLPIVVIALLVTLANLTSEPSAAVGSCVYNKGTAAKPNVKVVDCTASEADYKVVGRIDGTANGDECARFEDSTVSYTDESRSKKYTLCLAPN